jgi:hypothetical protein
MRKTVVWLLDFITLFVILILIGVGLIVLFPFQMVRNLIEPEPKKEKKECFSPSTDKPM